MFKLSSGLYHLALLFAPLAFGMHGPGARTVVEICLFSALFVYLVHLWQTGDSFYRVPALFPLVLLNGWMAFQLVPLPAGLVGFISPATLALYEDALGDAAHDSLLRLSINPQITVDETIRFLAYTACYVLTVQLLSKRKQLRKTVVLVVGFAGFLALEACWQKLFVGNKALGIWPASDPFGPFFYRNHFAGFMDMLLPLSLALAAFHQPYVKYAKTLRAKCIALLSDLKLDAFLVFFSSTIIMVTAVLLNPSMGGQIWAAVGCMILLGIAPDISVRRRVGAIVVIFLIAALSAGQVGRHSINYRFGETLENEVLEEDAQVTFHGRAEFWKDAVPIVADFPMTGTGSGSFHRIFPSYRTFSAWLNVSYAHNDYIQLAVELGGLGILLLALFGGFYLRSTVRAASRLRDRYARYVAVGCAVGAGALLLHCITEFQFYDNGAVGLYFFFFLGVIAAATHSSRSERVGTYLAATDNRTLLGLMALPCLFLIVLVPWLYQHHLAAKEILRSEKLLVTPAASEEDFAYLYDQAGELISLEPLNSYGWYLRAYAAEYLGEETTEDAYLHSLRLDPTNTLVLQRYSQYLEKGGRIDEANLRLQAAIRRDQSYPPLYQQYGQWLLKHGRVGEAKEVFRRIFVLVPRESGAEMEQLLAAGVPLAEIQELLPDLVGPWAAYARIVFEETGDVQQAAALYEKSLGFLGNEKRPMRSFFYAPYRFYVTIGQYEKAQNIIRRGVCLLPDDYGLHLALGDIYRHQGYKEMANEEYRKALQLRPDSPSAIDRLVDDAIKLRLEKFSRLGGR